MDQYYFYYGSRGGGKSTMAKEAYEKHFNKKHKDLTENLIDIMQNYQNKRRDKWKNL